MMSQDGGKKSSKRNPRVGSEGSPQPSTSAGSSGVDREREVARGTPPADQVAGSPRTGGKRRSGRPIEVYANFFRLIVNNPRLVVYRYHVTIEPEFPKSLIRAVWNKFASSTFPDRTTVFDGSKTCYSRGPLVEGGRCDAEVSVANPLDGAERAFRVSMQEVKTIDFSIFENYPERVRDIVQSQTSLDEQRTMLEVVMKNWAANAFLGNNRFFFLRTAGGRGASSRWSERAELGRGFYRTIFLGSVPFVNLDDSYGAFFREVGVLEVFENFRYGRTGKVNVEKANKFLQTAKILYYGPHNARARIYKVNRLVSDALGMFFRRADGSEMSVADYFACVKKYPLKHPTFPLLCVGPARDPTFLPAELCTLASQHVYEGPPDEEEAKWVKGPSAGSSIKSKRKNITELLHSMELLDNHYPKEFELTVAKTREKVSARVLDPPELKAGTKITVTNGVWGIQDLLEPMKMAKWCTVSLDRRATTESLVRFEDMVMRKGSELGMEVGNPARGTMETDPSRESIKRVFSQLKDMDMVFVVIPRGKMVYSRLKTICEIEEGVLTQCLQSKNLQTGDKALGVFVGSLLLKVNTKLGGKNYSLDESSIPECLRGCVMLVGVDVAHPKFGSNTPAVAAVAATSDPTALNYEIITRVQTGELIPQLEDVMKEHLDRFRAARNRFPEKVIVFRDGVSEADKATLIEIELTALKRACSGRGNPRITMVVVQKRHHTRIFPTSSTDEEGKNRNVPVGTCVDSDVDHPTEMDFILVSHSSRAGAARPTKYRLVHDDNDLTDDELERLTYYLCHLSSRSKISQSQPCPTQYAHLVAARARVYMEEMDLTVNDDPRRIQERIENRISSANPMFFV